MSVPKVGPQPLPKPTLEEKLAAFDSIPLFMKSLPDDPDDPMIAALQSLAHEGTPDGRSGLHSAAAIVSDWP
jgi:small subunit ribosomal protein S7e